MEPVTTGALILSSLKVVSKLLDSIPSYDQRKKEKFQSLVREYEKQKTLPFDHDDFNHDYFLNIRSELFGHVEEIRSSLYSKGKES